MTTAIVLAAAWGIAVAGCGAWLTDISPWYRAIRKPSWQPPDWLFGPAWTVILGLASYSGYLAWRDAGTSAVRSRQKNAGSASMTIHANGRIRKDYSNPDWF